MEDLEEQWNKLNLLEEEEAAIVFDEEVGEEISYRGECSLVGKVCMDRTISKEVVENTMKRVWKISKPAKFLEVDTNVFTITFANPADKYRVWSGRPWSFDYHLFALKLFEEDTPPQKLRFMQERFWIQFHNLPLSCMNEDRGRQLGNTIGVVEKVDVKEDGSGWGRYLRVLIVIDLQKPLARGRTINVKGEKLWIPIRYEKLPRFCFSCGCLIHEKGGCENKNVGTEQYGVWLRADMKRGEKIKREGESVNLMKNNVGKGGHIQVEGDDVANIEKGKKGLNGGKTNGMEEGLSEVESEEISAKENEKEGKLNGEVISNKQVEAVKKRTNGEEVMKGVGYEKELILVDEEQKGDLNETIQHLIIKKGEWKRRAREKGKNVINRGEQLVKKRRYEGEEGGAIKRLKEQKDSESGEGEEYNSSISMVVAVQQPHHSQ
ncbi:uncharacterized protein LOC118349709 [Juglans regia]|uniref:Uncharacterized protein LOC118349709 n=1 Tax=Juglans regia TaxID=51240 RepID=A0A6P9EQS3_JUGRE|nr:uncharacterized protein LOC118349709 [Juglans regia]